ncbi:Oligopeptide transport ATP-binding protein OppF [subsurface metagenome]
MIKEKIMVTNLKKHFQISKKDFVHAVDGVSFSIFEGEIMGLVGESGCGKTTVGRCILRLIEPDEGKVIFNEKNILDFSKKEMKRIRKEMQIIFQDPFSSLDPRKTVEQLISEPLKINLNKEIINKYPHELDGGRCQRIGLARAISLNPSFLVCDEPVSALDVSSQAQVLKLMEGLHEKFGLTYLFISHDLSVVRKLSQRIMVMYLGLIVEMADANELFNEPLHPYTKALLSAVPTLEVNNRKGKERIILKGDVPTPINLGEGCRFYKRCYKSLKKCAYTSPELVEISKNHFVRCHLYN